MQTVEGELDIQVQEALNDIANSYKMISNLKDKDVKKIYNGKELIDFHRTRIKNCLLALLEDIKNV